MDDSPFAIGPYAIGQSIGLHPGAKKLSWLDRLLQKPNVPGEIVYRSTERFPFLGGQWLMFLGVVQGRIYKLSARWSAETKPPMDAMLDAVVAYCRRQFGESINDHTLCWHPSFGTANVEPSGVTTDGRGMRGLFVIKFDVVAKLEIGGVAPFRHARN